MSIGDCFTFCYLLKFPTRRQSLLCVVLFKKSTYLYFQMGPSKVLIPIEKRDYNKEILPQIIKKPIIQTPNLWLFICNFFLKNILLFLIIFIFHKLFYSFLLKIDIFMWYILVILSLFPQLLSDNPYLPTTWMYSFSFLSH